MSDPSRDDLPRVDLLVIGAGPVGLACAIAARRQGLTARIVDKGALVNSIVGYPPRMEFFSTPELIEIGGHPFPTAGYKPTREEAIEYYAGVVRVEELDVRLYERVLSVEGEPDAFRVVTDRASTRAAGWSWPSASSTCRTGWASPARSRPGWSTTTGSPMGTPASGWRSSAARTRRRRRPWTATGTAPKSP